MDTKNVFTPLTVIWRKNGVFVEYVKSSSNNLQTVPRDFRKAIMREIERI